MEGDDFFPSYHHFPFPLAASVIAFHHIIGRAMA